MSLLASLFKGVRRAKSSTNMLPEATDVAHRFICATRMTEKGFWENSALVKYLSECGDTQRCEFSFAYDFTGNMCAYYNDAASSKNGDLILIFIMDHIGLIDPGWRTKLDAALLQFNVVGIRGNSDLTDGQPMWWLEELKRGSTTLSGSATIETMGGRTESKLGPSPLACKVLEPGFIAVRAKDLYEAEVDFDPNMGQSFLALDFCRSASKAGLSIGTWPIHISDASALVSPLVHAENWSDYFLKYREKWSISGVPK
jgi:hypothetical protein